MSDVGRRVSIENTPVGRVDRGDGVDVADVVYRGRGEYEMTEKMEQAVLMVLDLWDTRRLSASFALDIPNVTKAIIELRQALVQEPPKETIH